MNIPVKANNKVNLIKEIKSVLIGIRETNLRYKENGLVLELDQSIREMIDCIYKNENNEYVANVLFCTKPLYKYNYHGTIFEDDENQRKIS